MDNSQCASVGNGSSENMSMDTRPGLLTALLIIFIILGSCGFLTTLIVLPQQMRTRAEAMDAGDPSKSFVGKLQGGKNLNDEFIRVQREMTGDMYDKMLPLRPLTWAQAAANIMLSAALVLFAIVTFRRKDIGRKALVLVSALHLPFELLRFFLIYKTSIITSESMSVWMEKLQAAQGHTTPDAMPDMGTVTGAIMLVQSGAMLIGFLALYIFAIVYLRRQSPRNWCDE